jgi:hypothetical protein
MVYHKLVLSTSLLLVGGTNSTCLIKHLHAWMIQSTLESRLVLEIYVQRSIVVIMTKAFCNPV